MAKKTPNKPRAGIKLGSLVVDKITGFKGIATTLTEFGFGCVHVAVQAQHLTEDGDNIIPTESFDDQRIDVLAPPARSWPEPRKSPIRFGDTVRDSITGATGIVTGRTTSLD